MSNPLNTPGMPSHDVQQPSLAQTLESLIDLHTLSKVQAALVEVCNTKGEHLRGAWQDTASARTWERVGKRIAAIVPPYGQ